MISVFLISDLVSDLTAIDLKSNNRSLIMDIDDIFENNISVITRLRKNSLNGLIMHLSDGKIKKLFNLIQYENNIFKENKIIIITELGGEIERFKYLNTIGFVNFTVEDINLPKLISTIPFNYLSPFRLKFGESEVNIKEFGLDIKWASDLKVFRPDKISNDIGGGDEVLVYVLIWLMTFGSLASLIVFIFELSWKRGSKNTNEILHHNPRKPKKVRKIKVQCRSSNN